ncbi:MAG TPA: SusC/RagA family TonB-linked outer membrane protein [Chitinophagaceae bacterium]|jgi:TonB-linked SusC/RagA family outer membrane protein|nr:SusC/RagA family TonB-linked outer membrane protein [Chitinophagaceae bacterium]
MRKRLLLFAALLLFGVWTFSQNQRRITGQVKDESGPVSFATITETSTSNSVTSDVNGNFSITIAGNQITVTAVDHTPQTITVSGNVANITMVRSGGQLQEVVVTALGQTKAKAKVGYASSTFNSETINRTAPVSPLDALQGKIAGADISHIGGPGASTKVVLRGYGVIAGGSNQPLYVVDGVPLSDARFGSVNGNTDFGNSAGDINPSDIESITVLKGTAASSLYGSSAKNGAIMITTKRGRPGKLKVEYNGSANFSRVGKLPDFQKTFGQGWSGTFILSENGSWGPKLDGQERLWGSVVDNSQLLKPFSFIDDNVRDFYNTGTEYNNTIALSGGSDVTSFYFSYGNVTSNGVIPSNSDNLQRNSFALRTNSKFNKFTINSSFNYVNRKMNAPFTGQGVSAGTSTFENILQIPVDIKISDFRDYKNKFFNIDNYFTPYAENPYYPLYENRNTQNSDRFFGNVDANYKFTNELSAQLRVGGDFTNTRTFEYKAVNAPSPGSWNAGNNPESAPKNPDVGSVSEISNYLGVINGDFILKYNRNLNSDLTLEALAGYNYNQQSQKAVAASITNLVIPGFYNLSNSSVKPTATDQTILRRLMGVYGQAVLGYKNQLYLTLNARNDWSSTLPIDNNSFFYPGANVSWIASQTFDLSRTAISLLKFRAAYGKTGSDAPPYNVYPILTIGDVNLPFGSITFPFNNVSAFAIANTLGNQDLKPVITSEAELGTEIRFWKNRLGFDVAVYDKRTDGQIFTVPISPSTGYTGLVQNLGLVSNKGIEVSADGKPVATKDFTWSIIYTFSKNWNKVENLTGGPDKVILSSVYDVEMDAFPGKTVTGIYAPIPQFTPDGKIIVNPATGIPLADPTKAYYGDAAYDYMMGMVNTFTYKNWGLNFTLDYRRGGVMYSGTADLLLFTGNSYVTTYNDRRPFIIPNSVIQTGVDGNGHATYAENTTPIDELHYDSYWYPTSNLAQSYQDRIIDRSFLKLRDISLSYNFPKKWASKISATNLNLAVYGRNFLLWTPQSNIYIDPEASNLGNDLTSQLGEFRTSPVSVQFGVQLRATF